MKYTKENPLVVWHFAGDTLRDGSPLPAVGAVLPEIKNPVPCERGWHGGVLLLDALRYAPGCMLAKRGLYGEVLAHGDDKHCASNAVMLAPYVDVRAALVRFARRAALHALRVDAADALDWAGLKAHAETLRALSDDCDLRSAARSAYSAADSACSARSADSARSAARSAYSAADSACSARSAACSAYSAYSAYSAARSAYSAARKRLNAWLIEEVSK